MPSHCIPAQAGACLGAGPQGGGIGSGLCPLMATKTLTDFAARNAKAKDKPYKLAAGGGLYLEVMPNGSKYWRMKYRFAGREKRLAVGVYPEVTLREVVIKRDDARAGLREPCGCKFVRDPDETEESFRARWHTPNECIRGHA